MIPELYAQETAMKEKSLLPENVLAYRTGHVKPVVDRIDEEHVAEAIAYRTLDRGARRGEGVAPKLIGRRQGASREDWGAKAGTAREVVVGQWPLPSGHVKCGNQRAMELF